MAAAGISGVRRSAAQVECAPRSLHLSQVFAETLLGALLCAFLIRGWSWNGW